MPLASQLSYNILAVPPTEAIRPAIVVLILTAIVLALVARWTRDLALASALVSVGSIVFFVHGHIYTLMLAALDASGVPSSFPSLAPALVIVPHLVLFACEVLCVLAVARLIGRTEQNVATANRFLLGLSVLALAIPVIQIGAYYVHRETPTATAGPLPAAGSHPGLGSTGSLPDVYYIILDGYGRADMLKEGYDVDTSAFLDALRSMGFQVADQSTSNYGFTLLSLTSSLNMVYLDDLVGPLTPETPFGNVVDSLVPKLRNSAVRQYFESHGYRTVAFATGFSWTDLYNADEYKQPSFQGIGAFESILIRTSMLGMVEDVASAIGLPYPYSGYGAHRKRITYALDELPKVAAEPGPKFVFVHLVLPHPPFSFDRNGDPYPERHAYTIGDATEYGGMPDEYIHGYREGVLFIDHAIIPVLQGIVDQSAVPPVILLQGDHGPGARLDWDHPTPRALAERMAILNAYYIPASYGVVVPQTITPVNSFRMVLRDVLGADIAMLPDRASYSSHNHPYQFIPYQEQTP
jgi:hypothetical protein